MDDIVDASPAVGLALSLAPPPPLLPPTDGSSISLLSAYWRTPTAISVDISAMPEIAATAMPNVVRGEVIACLSGAGLGAVPIRRLLPSVAVAGGAGDDGAGGCTCDLSAVHPGPV